MKLVRLFSLSVGVPLVILALFFFLQGMFGGKTFFLILSSVFFLCGSYFLVKSDGTKALIYAFAYALFVQYFMWDRSILLVCSMFAALFIPKLITPFVSQIDVEIGRVITIISGLVVFTTTQGLLLHISLTTSFLFFTVCVAILALAVKARSAQGANQSYDQP